MVIVSQAMARYYFKDQSPIGRTLAWRMGPNWSPAAADCRRRGRHPRRRSHRKAEDDAVSPGHAGERGLDAAGAHGGSTDQLTPRVVETIRSLDPNRPVDHVQTLEELRDETIAPQRLNATLIGLFALLALAIAMVGVGGVLAFSVSQRTNELGIRMALGAEPGTILRMILGEGAMMAAIGLVIGGLLSAPLSRMLERAAVWRAAARSADDRGGGGAAGRRGAGRGVGAGAPGDGGRADGRAAARVTSRRFVL